MRCLATVLCLLFLTVCVPAPHEDFNLLDQQLREFVRDFPGKVGYYVRDLSTGRELGLQSDSLFPTASMIKVPILLKLFDRLENPAEDDTLNYHSLLTWMEDSIHYAYDGGILSSFEDGRTIRLEKVVSLMITYSDNHASLWCQKLAGGGAAINAWLAQAGFSNTRLNSRTPGRHGDWERYGWGQTTPREMAELLVMIREGRAVNALASEEMYRVLGRTFWDGEALSAIPPTVRAASKQGAVGESRSEVVLVNAPYGDYVFCLITDDQEDQGWDDDNPGYVLLRNFSKTLWEFFEGKGQGD